MKRRELLAPLGPGCDAHVRAVFSTKAEGTGLGLAISNTLVRAHGGSLSYRPNMPHGACFSVRLPTET